MSKTLLNRCEANTGGNMVSETGPNFALGGTPAFQAGKFNNSVKIPGYSDTVMATLTSAFSTGKFTFCYYQKTSFAVVNGGTAASYAHWNMGRRTDSDPAPSIFLFNYPLAYNGMQMQIATSSQLQIASGFDTDINWGAGEWHHHAWTFDKDAASNNINYYLDGVLVHSWTVTWADDSLNGRKFYLSYGQEDWDIASANMEFDALNLLSGECLTDFSDYLLYEDGSGPPASNQFFIINC